MKNIYKKLQEVRIELHKAGLKKTGQNKYAGYKYFEIGDIVPPIQYLCGQVGLCPVCSYANDLAWMTIYDSDSEASVVVVLPFGRAELKGCHEVQNLGAAITYIRRYLYQIAFELSEKDILDSVFGKDETKKKTKIMMPSKLMN